jgi:hypothetical protein
MNISSNFISCPLCKNIFLKTHIKIHYIECKKKESDKLINQNNKKTEIINQNNKRSEIINQNNKKAEIINQNNKRSEIINQNNKKEDLNKEYNYKNNSKNNSKNDKNEKDISNNSYKEMQIEKYIQPNIVSYNDNMLNYFFNQYDKLFREYILDKSIALVGPAQSIIGTCKGSIIDNFDLIVRLNKSIPLPTNIYEDIGSRTDIVYNSLNTQDFPGENNLNPKLYKKYGVKFVCSSYPFNHNIFHNDILNYVYKYKFELPLKVMNDMKFKKFENLLGTRPYTGTCAIMDLLSYPIKYLYITGLDFYHTKYYNEYRRISKDGLKHTKNSPIHQAKPQLDYLKHISFFDNRIILDSYLDKIIYHDYYKVTKNLFTYNKSEIFNFGDTYFQKYFEMKLSKCTYTKEDYNINKNYDENPFLIFTDNKNYRKNDKEYSIFISNDKNMVNFLNNNLTTKKFLGNFFFTENRINPHFINFNSKYLSTLKSILHRVDINNCSVNLAILLSLMLYLPDKHFFSYNEIFNKWNISIEEKKLILFLEKKKVLLLM